MRGGLWECLLCSGRFKRLWVLVLECWSTLYVCVRGVMDVVFSVCIMTRGAVGARVWEVWVFRHAGVVYLCPSCGSSQCCVLHALQFVNAGRGCTRPSYGKGILQNRSHDCLIGSHGCLLLFAALCCYECFLIICSGLYACAEMLWMCVLYVSLVSKVGPRTLGCVAMGSEVLYNLSSRLILYTAGSEVNRVQVVLSGFSVILFCFVRKKHCVCMVVCISLLHSCLCM